MISYDKLRKLLKDKGVIILEFNKAIGCDSNNIMSGRVGTSTGTIETMCKYLKCNVSDIIEWKEDSDVSSDNSIVINDSFFEELLSRFSSYRAASLFLEKGASYFHRLSTSKVMKKYIFQSLCEKLDLNAEDYYD